MPDACPNLSASWTRLCRLPLLIPCFIPKRINLYVMSSLHITRDHPSKVSYQIYSIVNYRNFNDFFTYHPNTTSLPSKKKRRNTTALEDHIHIVLALERKVEKKELICWTCELLNYYCWITELYD